MSAFYVLQPAVAGNRFIESLSSSYMYALPLSQAMHMVQTSHLQGACLEESWVKINLKRTQKLFPIFPYNCALDSVILILLTCHF